MRTVSVVLSTILFATSATATPVGADWVTTSSGTLNGTAFTTTGFGGPFLGIQNSPLSGADYSAAPLGVVKSLQYSADNDWTVTFASPMTNLLVYVYQWRGDFNGGVVDPTSTYAFSRPFTILSGLVGSSVAGNTLSLPDLESSGRSFFFGILQFSGAVTTLSVDATALNASGQVITFGVNTVPEPVTFAMIGSGLLVAGWFRRRAR
jgi:hypothetical protein